MNQNARWNSEISFKLFTYTHKQSVLQFAIPSPSKFNEFTNWLEKEPRNSSWQLKDTNSGFRRKGNIRKQTLKKNRKKTYIYIYIYMCVCVCVCVCVCMCVYILKKCSLFFGIAGIVESKRKFENCDFLVYYAACRGNSLPTFRDL